MVPLPFVDDTDNFTEVDQLCGGTRTVPDPYARNRITSVHNTLQHYNPYPELQYVYVSYVQNFMSDSERTILR